jgi:hypothetical protein
MHFTDLLNVDPLRFCSKIRISRNATRIRQNFIVKFIILKVLILRACRLLPCYSFCLLFANNFSMWRHEINILKFLGPFFNLYLLLFKEDPRFFR